MSSTITGTAGADYLSGTSGADLLSGGAGNDTLVGGAGADTLLGGDGNDSLYIDAADAVIDGGAGFDTAFVQGSGGVNLMLAAIAIERVYGGSGADTVSGVGATGTVEINAGGGDDVLTGGAFNDSLRGDAGNDWVEGNDGNDWLEGGAGADTLLGGEGNDSLFIDADDAVIDGGAGFDTAYVQGTGGVALNLAAKAIERVYGGVGADTLTGVDATATVEINAGGGDDLVTGSAFADSVRGDAGNDWVEGGAGNDLLDGGTGRDTLFGGDGDDRLFIDADDAVVDGGTGYDTAFVQSPAGVLLNLAAANIERVYGGAGADTLTGIDATATVEINAGGGNDLVTGSAYNDSLRGDAGNDWVEGGTGNDWLEGGAGTDTLLGGDGNDSLFVDADDTVVDGGTGYDTAYVQGSAGVLLNLAAANIERVYGGSGADTLMAAVAVAGVEINAGGGDDVLVGSAFADWLRGDAGVDTVDYGLSTAGVTVSLANGTGSGGSAAGDRLSGVENLIGSAYADRLTGDAGMNRLVGGSGNDTLIGGAGIDTAVFAGSVRDYVTGKAGSTWTIRATGGSEGTDTLQEMEWAQFADALMRLDANNAPLLSGGLAVSTDEDSAPLMVDLLQGSWDFDGDMLSVTGFSQSGGPVASVVLNGGLLSLDLNQFNHLAAGQSETLTFAYGVSDGMATVAQTFVATVQGRNDAPVAVADTVQALFETPILIAPGSLLANDSDPDDGSVLCIIDVSGADHGVARLNTDGSILFAPADGFTGNASFRYTVSDGNGGESQGSVAVVVRSAPVVSSNTTSLVAGPEVAMSAQQSGARIAALDGGGYAALYLNNSRISVQVLDAAGVPQGQPTVLNGGPYPWAATLTGLKGGGFVVTWSSDSNAATMDVLAQRFDAAGVAQGGVVRVNSYTPYAQGASVVARLDDGGYVIAWHTEVEDGSSFGVYAQRYDANGQAQGGEFRVNQATANEQLLGSVVGLDGGRYAVTWYSRQSGSWALYQRQYDASGAITAETPLAGWGGSWPHPWQMQSAKLAGGGYVTAYWDVDGAGGYDVYTMRFAANGAALAGPERVNSYRIGDQHTVALTATADGGYVVGWQSNGQDGSGWGVYAQRYDAGGAKIGNEFRLSDATAGDQFQPSLAGSPDGGFVAAWNGSTPAARLYRGAETSGTVQGTAGDDVFVSTSMQESFVGGTGEDAFRFVAPDLGGDAILDFQSGLDRIEVAGVAFGGLPLGSLDPGRFALNTATDTDDCIIFNTTTGVLSYDADGIGSAAPTAIALLNIRTLAASDIRVVAST